MANLIDEDVAGQIKEIFGQLNEPVEVLFFGKNEGCETCDDTRQLVEEVVALSDKIEMSIHDLEGDREVAEKYSVDKAPGLVIAGRDGDRIQDYGVRYAGIPSGHEFSSFINDLIVVSGRDSGLSQKTRDFLKGLEEPVLLQVFVTPT